MGIHLLMASKRASNPPSLRSSSAFSAEQRTVWWARPMPAPSRDVVLFTKQFINNKLDWLINSWNYSFTCWRVGHLPFPGGWCATTADIRDIWTVPVRLRNVRKRWSAPAAAAECCTCPARRWPANAGCTATGRQRPLSRTSYVLHNRKWNLFIHNPIQYDWNCLSYKILKRFWPIFALIPKLWQDLT